MPVYLLFKHVVPLKNRKSIFTFGLNAAKNTHYSKKIFKWKFFGIEVRTKKSARAYVHLPAPRVELGGSKDDMVEMYLLLTLRTDAHLRYLSSYLPYEYWNSPLNNMGRNKQTKWNQNQTKMSNNFLEFPYALVLFDKDISEYSRASALCSKQLAQLFRVYVE